MKLGELPEAEVARRLQTRRGLALELGPFVMRISTRYPEVIPGIALLYRDYRVAGDEEFVNFSVTLAPPSRWQRLRRSELTAFVDGQRAFYSLPRVQALPVLEWAINWCLFTQPNHFLILHAGVVARGGSALVLPGQPGAGKSTLAAALALRGWRLLSDETALIRPGTCEVTPVPRPVSLKDASIEVIRHFSSAAVLGPSCSGTRKGTVAHLRAPGDSVSQGRQTAIARWIVLPAYDPASVASLTPLSRAEAFLQMGSESFNYSLLGAQGFDTLAGLVAGCDCYRLRYRDLDKAIALIDRLASAQHTVAESVGAQ